MGKAIFVTGTGTDIGKTYVSGLLVKALRDSGIKAGYYKPALSGADVINGRYIPGDCKYVADFAKLPAAPQELSSYIYKTAVSPHLAAQLEHQPIEADVILADFSKFSRQYDYLVVEGCGGLVCPLRLDDNSLSLMQTDIIKLLKLDLIVVASAGLGSINSAVLTAHYATSHNLTIKGFIFNNYDDNDFLHKDNKNIIKRLTNLPTLACVPSNAAQLAMDMTTLCSQFTEV